MDERQHAEKMARLNLRMEEEEEEQADAEYQDFLRQETERMRQRGFTPRVRTSFFYFTVSCMGLTLLNKGENSNWLLVKKKQMVKNKEDIFTKRRQDTNTKNTRAAHVQVSLPGGSLLQTNVLNKKCPRIYTCV